MVTAKHNNDFSVTPALSTDSVEIQALIPGEPPCNVPSNKCSLRLLSGKQKKVFLIVFLVLLSVVTLISLHDQTASIILPFENDSNNHSSVDVTWDNDNVNNLNPYPEVKKSDIIYEQDYHTAIVNDEYKLIYFHIGKVASSEFKNMLKRLNRDPSWCDISDPLMVHRRGMNGLKYLAYDYSIKEVEEMMTNDEWTKAIFARDPKPRLLSGFLDKAVQQKHNFETSYCPSWQKWKGGDDAKLQYCYDHRKDFSFFLHEITRMNTQDLHFRSVDSFVDKKWWPYINFIGYMDSLSADSKRLFKSIKSDVDGISAWERAGSTGWSPELSCDNTGDEEFLQEKPSGHKTGAREHMMQYYTPNLEKFVEKNWVSDYENEFLHFPEIRLYNNKNDENARRGLVDDGRNW